MWCTIFFFVIVQLIVVKLISIICNNWNVCITCQDFSRIISVEHVYSVFVEGRHYSSTLELVIYQRYREIFSTSGAQRGARNSTSKREFLGAGFTGTRKGDTL